MQREEPYSTFLYTPAHPPLPPITTTTTTPSGLTVGRGKSGPVVIALPSHRSGLSSSAGTDLEIV